MRGFAVVLGTAVVAWLMLAGPAALISDEGPSVTIPAALVCLVPNLLALGVAGLVRGEEPTDPDGCVAGVVFDSAAGGVGLGAGGLLSSPGPPGSSACPCSSGGPCSI